MENGLENKLLKTYINSSPNIFSLNIDQFQTYFNTLFYFRLGKTFI